MKRKFLKTLRELLQNCYFCEVNHDFASAKALQQKIGELIYDEAVWNGLQIGDPDAGGEIKTVEV